MTIDMYRATTDKAEPLPRSFESYQVGEITDSHPDIESVRIIVRKIQGEDYLRSGYIEPSKLTPSGEMPDDIDEDRIAVSYHIAYPKGGDVTDTEASLKRLAPKSAGDYSVLPAYVYSKDALYLDGRQYLADHAHDIVEIGGLSRVNDATSKMVSHEIMRDIMQRVVLKGSNEKWLMTFADKAHRAMVQSFGEEIICRIGEPVVIDELDEHVTLFPCIIDPSKVIERLPAAIDASQSDEVRNRRIMSLLFMADGLDIGDSRQVPTGVRSRIEKINATMAELGGAKE